MQSLQEQFHMNNYSYIIDNYLFWAYTYNTHMNTYSSVQLKG